MILRNDYLDRGRAVNVEAKSLKVPIESYTTINILKKDNLPIHKKTIITIHRKGQQYMFDGIFDGILLIRLN